jgi:hypothetical protein
MFCYYPRRGVPTPAPDPGAAPNVPIPTGLPASPSSGRSGERREESLRQVLRRDWAIREVQAAELIDAVDAATGRRCGLFYGDPAIESRPIHPSRPWDRPPVLEVRVDREGDDCAILAAAVERIKGSCHFVADLRKILSEPATVGNLRRSDLSFAVDAATGERCGLFYGDPATESLPIYHLEPWRQPAVLEVYVDPLSDDRAVLASAVREIKGSCCDPAMP